MKYGLFLRLSNTEAAKLRIDAKRCGMSMTGYLRHLISGAEIKERPTEAIDKCRTELHHIGNNINQATRKINASLGTKQDVDTLIYLMEECYRLMYEMAKE